MRRAQTHCMIDVSKRFRQRLLRQRVHQIEIEVVEIIARDRHGAARLVIVVNSAQCFEVGWIKTLDPDRQTVNAELAVGGKFLHLKGTGIGLQRDLRSRRERDAGAHFAQQAIQ